MNDVQIFNNEDFGQVRTVNIDGGPWFVGKDVAIALGYKDTVSAIKTHVDGDDKRGWRITTPSGTQEMTIINESGLYSLIFGSSLPNAKDFKKWVTGKVLPSIRQTGSYSLPQTIDERVALALRCSADANLRVEKVEKEVETLKQELPLFPVELERITAAVKKRGVDILGGKESAAYHNRSIASSVYRDIYREIYRNFDVTSYKMLRRCYLDRVEGVVDAYKPPVVLSDMITEVNAA